MARYSTMFLKMCCCIHTGSTFHHEASVDLRECALSFHSNVPSLICFSKRVMQSESAWRCTRLYICDEHGASVTTEYHSTNRHSSHSLQISCAKVFTRTVKVEQTKRLLTTESLRQVFLIQYVTHPRIEVDQHVLHLDQ